MPSPSQPPVPALLRLCLIVLVLLGSGAVEAAEGGERVALVVGIGGYAHAPELPAARDGARAMAEALRTRGFAVEERIDPDAAALTDALRGFGTRARAAEVALLYVAGHGLQADGVNHLIPADATLAGKPDVAREAVRLGSALEAVAQAKALGILVLDASRRNPFVERLEPAANDQSTVRAGFGHIGELPPRTLVATATRAEAIAEDGPGPHSPYTAALLKHLEEPGLELGIFLRRVRDTVVQATQGRQEPGIYGSLGATPFYFHPRPQAAQAEPPGEPAAASPPGGDVEEALWQRVRTSNSVEEVEAFLHLFGSGRYAVPARERLAALKAPPAAPPEAANPEVEPLDGTFVAVRDTNMRAGPDIKAPVLRTLRRDTEVTATGRARKGNWTRVTVDGQEGFIAGANLKRSEPPAPAVAQGAPAQNAPAQAAPASVGGAVGPGVHRLLRTTTMFERPVLGARGVRDLPAGMLLTVVEAVPGTNWLRVRDRFGQEGFVTAGVLTDTDEAPAPNAARVATVERSEEPGFGSSGGDALPSGSSEIASLPPEAMPSPAVQEAMRAARAEAAAGERAGNDARAAAGRGGEARMRARAAAETARGGLLRAGVHRFPNGDVYEGEWAMSVSGALPRMEKSGYGVYRFADGQVYEGEWRGDRIAGSGAMTFSTGDRYEGSFDGGLPSGLGVYRYANGDEYAGEVRRNRPDGVGELAYANGDRYVGEVSDRKPSGFGVLTRRAAGGQHIGRFRDGVQDGPGMAVSTRDGNRRAGLWQGSRLVE